MIKPFYFDFRCGFESSPQWVDFGFHGLLLRHFVPNVVAQELAGFISSQSVKAAAEVQCIVSAYW